MLENVFSAHCCRIMFQQGAFCLQKACKIVQWGYDTRAKNKRSARFFNRTSIAASAIYILTICDTSMQNSLDHLHSLITIKGCKWSGSPFFLAQEHVGEANTTTLNTAELPVLKRIKSNLARYAGNPTRNWTRQEETNTVVI